MFTNISFKVFSALPFVSIMCDQNRFLWPVDISARTVHCRFEAQRILHGAQAPWTWRKYPPFWNFQCSVIWQYFPNFFIFLWSLDDGVLFTLQFSVEIEPHLTCPTGRMAWRDTERNIFQYLYVFWESFQTLTHIYCNMLYSRGMLY